MARVAYAIITGFLGAGKTTLLRRLIRSPFAAQRRIAFIVNDFADVDVDGRTLALEAGGAFTIARLSSGCICCTIRSEFERTLNDLVAREQPDMVIVESSGVASPSTVTVAQNNPRLRLDAVVTVVDAERFLDYMRYSATVEFQVYLADFVLLNKRDLVTEAQLAQVEARVRQFNRKAVILPTQFCDVPPEVLFGAHLHHTARDFSLLSFEADHLTRDAIESVWLPVPGQLDETKLTAFLRSEAVRDVYRAKGFIQLAGEDKPMLLNFVPRRYGLERLFEDPGERFILFIGRNLRQRVQALGEGLTQCAIEPLTHRESGAG
ncbi:MAG: GTP-binding protein [Anaerolineae bacterium]|nr:GTP-binding protein [Thermoflexales bacterium]MDW8396166.1 GTP-binding protein [Anaerolineae bacterium]